MTGEKYQTQEDKELVKKYAVLKVGRILSKKSKKITLDLGCGKYKDPAAIGLEGNPEYVKLYGEDECIEWDLLDPLPFPSESVEGVLAFHVLEHFKYPMNLVNEAHKVLKEGGMFSIKYPVNDDLDNAELAEGCDKGHQVQIGANWCEENHVFDLFDLKCKEVREREIPEKKFDECFMVMVKK